MIKHLTKHGNSLFLRPVKDPKSKKDLNTTLEEINRDFGPSLRRLA